MVERWGPRARGIGDDGAVLTVPRGDSLVVSVDSSVEDHHFRRDWLTPREIGYRSVAAAMSDLAAMAARPLGVLVAISIPAEWREALPNIADGIGDAVDQTGTVILGGNLSGGRELSITTTVLGFAFKPLVRSGAEPGDRIYVTGRLGGPGAALAALERGEQPGARARDAYARPRPRLAESVWLAEQGASAAIDISDGLAGDLAHLAAASKISIAVDVDRIPTLDDIDPDAALRSGEEYELLVTCPRELDGEAFVRRFAIPLTEIGRVTARDEETNVVLRQGGNRVANPLGHDHFSR
jgi:thiamine-monophosphate kinase